MSNNKKVITKKDWLSKFSITGQAKVNDYTYKIDAISEKSSWIYNSLNLGVNCGEKYGTVYTEMMGGYSGEKSSVIYAHGKKEDGTDDFDNQIIVQWNDRFNQSILDTIGNSSFIVVGLEKADKDKVIYTKFLSAYDAIDYIQKHLENDTIVNIRGNLKYSIYQDKVQVHKNINSIVLSQAEESKYSARFLQTILLDKESIDLHSINTNNGSIFINGRVLDYLKESNGIEVKGQYPFTKEFEYEFPDFNDKEMCKKIINKIFKVKKDITQITFEGDFIEGGATINVTLDDIPDDIKDLIDCGIYTKEEALQKCSSSGNKQQRMVLRKPVTRLVGEEKMPVLQIFPERYTEDDLYLDYLFDNKNNELNFNLNDFETVFGGETKEDWLND